MRYSRESLSLCYSIAEQNVLTTKSIGIYNFSIRLLQHICEQDEIDNLTILANPTLEDVHQLKGHPAVISKKTPLDRRWGRIFWDQLGVYRAAKNSKCNWLFLPKGFLSFLMRPPIPTAAYVHDVMGEYYRKTYPSVKYNLENKYFSGCLRSTLCNAAVVFTNTDFSRSEILKLADNWGLAEPNVVGAGYGFVSNPLNNIKKENKILFFASDQPHKRTDIGVQFIEDWLHSSDFNGQIDCVGIFSKKPISAYSSSWNWVGRVPPKLIVEMMQKARAVIYTSDYEGFGMPPVESVLSGTCPVYSDIPPLREVMGNAGFSFSNNSSEAFSRALNKALNTSSETIRVWQKNLLARHNWQNVASIILNELKRLSKQRK